jgi:hypothetical protein
MATAWMIDDRLQIDGFDPYTWSGTYGVNTDGFRKDTFIDGSYYTQVDEVPMEMQDQVEESQNPEFNTSGAMYVKTASVNPAPYRMFPTRKFEYADGTCTWYRPDMPWSWMGSGSGDSLGRWIAAKGVRGDNLIFYVVLAILAYFLFKKFKN